MTNEPIELTENEAQRVREYLDGNPDVEKRYESKKSTLYSVKSGLGGRVLLTKRDDGLVGLSMLSLEKRTREELLKQVAQIIVT